MNILFVTPLDPHEVRYGGQQRNHVLWNGLKSIGEVWTVVPVYRSSDEVRDESRHFYKLCVDRRYTLGWFFRHLLNRFMPEVSVSLGVTSRAIEKLGVKFDVVVVKSLWMAGLLRLWHIAPMYVDVDDTPTDDYVLANPGRRIRIWILSRWQDYLCRKAHLLWVPDPEQVDRLKPFRVAHLPNIPIGDISLVDRSKVDLNRLLFLGYLAHRPNIVAVDWFLENFWDKLKKRFPNLVLDVVGGGLPSDYVDRWSSYRDVVLHGFVQDVTTFFERSLALITPMRIGSGTCIKVLESLARGVPVISTEQGLRGILKSERTATNGMFSFRDLVDLKKAIEDCTRERDGIRKTEFIANGFTQEVVNGILKTGLECDRKGKELI